MVTMHHKEVFKFSVEKQNNNCYASSLSIVQLLYNFAFLTVLELVSFLYLRNHQDGETFVRTLTDCWVVGKKSDQREMVVVINQKNLNLIEVNGR